MEHFEKKHYLIVIRNIDSVEKTSSARLLNPKPVQSSWGGGGREEQASSGSPRFSSTSLTIPIGLDFDCRSYKCQKFYEKHGVSSKSMLKTLGNPMLAKLGKVLRYLEV